MKLERDKLDFMKNLKFVSSKDTIHRVKVLPIEWERIFGNHISGGKGKCWSLSHVQLFSTPWTL